MIGARAERRRAERSLAFLQEFSAALASASTAAEIGEVATARVAGHFGATRCLLVEIDVAAETATVFCEHGPPGSAALAGVYRIGEFHTEAERRALSDGEPVAIDDVWGEPRSPDAAARFAALGVASLVNAPYVGDGRWKFVLSVMRAEPHAWRADEADLLRELAARIYLRVERARSDEALRAAHDSFRHLVENSPFGVYAVDADFRLALVSLGAARVFENVRPLLGRDFAEVIRVVWPEPFATEAIGHFRRTLATGVAYHAPASVERRQDIGEVESYDWKIERVTLPDGRPGAVCHFYDLSERQRHEAAIVARERELQTLADNTPDILTRFDRGLQHVFVNAAVERATGRRRSDFIGRTNREMGMPTALCDQWEAAIRGVFERGQLTSMEFAFDTPAGRRHYAARLVPEFGADGATEFVLGVTRDVTEARAAEVALRESEERLRMALTAARAGAWAWDITDDVVTWSPENYALYGVDPAAGPLRYAAWVARIHPDDRARTSAALQDALARRRDEYRVEFRLNEPGAAERWLLGLGRVEFGPDGAPARMAGINLDLTERKRFEQALAEQDRRKDEFLATLAHELRNPLAPIRNGVEIIRLAGADGEAVERARAVIERQLGHLVRLVDDLLDVSRVSRGKIELHRRPLDLASVAHHAVETCRALIDARGHTLAVTTPADPLRVEGDFVRLTQVVSNLLHNAAKYTDPGGRIALTVARDGAEAVLEVRDSGRGIDPRVLPHLFDLFFQADRDLDRADGGLGIGLSLVRSLVEMHGGRVEAASAGRGGGSEFTVRLPVLTGAAVAPAAPPTAGARAATRVLVVDDNVDAAESLAVLLGLDGHEVLVSHDGLEAVEVALRERPSVVLLDIGLPGLTGYEVCREIRMGGLTDALIVAVTGYGQEQDRRLAREAGFDAHQVKPVDPEVLRALLATGPAP